jgi:hypothetical protein
MRVRATESILVALLLSLVLLAFIGDSATRVVPINVGVLLPCVEAQLRDMIVERCFVFYG